MGPWSPPPAPTFAPPGGAAPGSLPVVPPQVTVQFGEPLSFPVERAPGHERQLEVAREIFDRVREMYAALEEKQASHQLNEA